jgi:hypothetical protein
MNACAGFTDDNIHHDVWHRILPTISSHPIPDHRKRSRPGGEHNFFYPAKKQKADDEEGKDVEIKDWEEPEQEWQDRSGT